MDPNGPAEKIEVRRRSMYCVVPVWGERYRRIYLDYVLASHLSPRNLAGLRYPDDHRYLIVTDEDSRAIIEASPQYRRLRATIRAEIRVLPPAPVTHDHMSDCYRVAIAMAGRNDAAVVFLFADGVFSDGTFPRLEELLNTGHDAVFCAGIRVTDGPARQALRTMQLADGTLLAPPRALMRLGLDNLHEWTYGSFWEDDDYWTGMPLPLLPSNLLWRAGPNAILARCFHLHPLLVYPQIETFEFDSTVDDYFVLAAGVEQDRIHVIEDSDELCFIDLTERKRHLSTDMRKGSIQDAARWASGFANPLHRYLATRPIRLHAGDIEETRWRETGVRSEAVMGAISDEIKRRERPWVLTRDTQHLPHYLARLHREHSAKYNVVRAQYKMRRAALKAGSLRLAKSAPTHSRPPMDGQASYNDERYRDANGNRPLPAAHPGFSSESAVAFLARRIGPASARAASPAAFNVRLSLIHAGCAGIFGAGAYSLIVSNARVRLLNAVCRLSFALRLLLVGAAHLVDTSLLNLHQLTLQLRVLPQRINGWFNAIGSAALDALHRWLFGPPHEPTVFSWRRAGIDQLVSCLDKVHFHFGHGSTNAGYVILGKGDLLLARHAITSGARAYRLAEEADQPVIRALDGGAPGRHDLLLVECLREFPNYEDALPDWADALRDLANESARLVVLTRYADGACALVVGAPPLSIDNAFIAGAREWQRVDATMIGGGATLAFARVVVNLRHGVYKFPRFLPFRIAAHLTMWTLLTVAGPLINWWIARNDLTNQREKSSWSLIEIYESSSIVAGLEPAASD